MNILIGGAVGHIGSNITIEAIKRGHRVIAFDNLHREQVIKNLEYLRKTYTEDQFTFIWGDCRNTDDFDRIPKNIDAIIWLCANPGIPWSIQWPTYDFDTNARGTLNALEFSRKCGNIPFIYASTNKTFSDIINYIPKIEEDKRYSWQLHNGRHIIEMLMSDIKEQAYDGIEWSKNLKEGRTFPIGIKETFPVSGFGKYGHSMYGISKLTGELYATEYHVQYGLPVVINKMSCIYGLFQKGAVEQGWISWFIQACMQDKPIEIYGTGKQVRDVLDARDVARLYIDEIEDLFGINMKSNGEVFTVGGGTEQTLSLLEAIEEIESQVGKKLKKTFHEKRPADQDIYVSSLQKVKNILGWKPEIPIKQTIADMIQEYSI